MSGEEKIITPYGLPDDLPAGEHVIWQGKPDFKSMARRALHLPLIGAYFAVLLVWSVSSSLAAGGDVASAFASSVWLFGLAPLALGTLALVGWLACRTTVYTLTSRRLVMRIGIALPIHVNIPFKSIEDVSLRRHKDGSGDISLKTEHTGGLGYAILWPHARPWSLGRPQPMLRSVRKAEEVAGRLLEQMRLTATRCETADNARRHDGNGLSEPAAA